VSTISPAIARRPATKDISAKWTWTNAVATILASEADVSTHRAVTAVCARAKMIADVIVIVKILAGSSP
jgi:hypothetical protein